ncbi:MAG: NAD(+) synthase [Deltaproteobacteria bacterium]|nr:NAD(+) synthase [Deltaproteobacteria bacterium]
MKLLKVAAAALNQTPLDWHGNTDRILKAMEQASEEGCAILCLPELCITGYGCEDAFLATHLADTAMRILTEKLLPASRGMAVSVGLPLRYRRTLFNVAAMMVDGVLTGFVAKQNLAGQGIHYEPRWFRPWPEGRQVEVEVAGKNIPLGDLFFNLGGVRIGFEICEDAWAVERPGSDLASKGVDILLNPSASHFAFGKHKVRQRLVLEGARAFGVSYVYANLLGNEAGRAIYDGGALIASAGKLLACGPRFSFEDVQLTSAVVDVDVTRSNQSSNMSFDPELNQDGPEVVKVAHSLREQQHPGPQEAKWALWEQRGTLKEEEFTRVLALALFDYLRKSHSKGFVVSLSGGADSAACASLVALMLRMAREELDEGELGRKLGQPHDGKSWGPAQILCTVYQATANSSQTTREAARLVAKSLGATHLEFEVESLVQEYTKMVAASLGRPLKWETDDVALQNIQARVRAPGAWMLANLKQALLLATSNRSEAAVGYATMDGDTCGGLSPIAGIDKAFLQRWLRWLERTGPLGLGPIPELKAVNELAPTAELRPAEQHQTDESDLMPYDILDAIERAAIRDKRSPMETWELMQAAFPNQEAVQVGQWVKKFFILWCRNQWKRERYAPSFHLDDENLDPKTWCRFPILSGGFEMELEALDEALNTKQTAEKSKT